MGQTAVLSKLHAPPGGDFRDTEKVDDLGELLFPRAGCERILG
jgi:hypothetical protein